MEAIVFFLVFGDSAKTKKKASHFNILLNSKVYCQGEDVIETDYQSCGSQSMGLQEASVTSLLNQYLDIVRVFNFYLHLFQILSYHHTEYGMCNITR